MGLRVMRPTVLLFAIAVAGLAVTPAASAQVPPAPPAPPAHECTFEPGSRWAWCDVRGESGRVLAGCESFEVWTQCNAAVYSPRGASVELSCQRGMWDGTGEAGEGASWRYDSCAGWVIMRSFEAFAHCEGMQYSAGAYGNARQRCQARASGPLTGEPLGSLTCRSGTDGESDYDHCDGHLSFRGFEFECHRDASQTRPDCSTNAPGRAVGVSRWAERQLESQLGMQIGAVDAAIGALREIV